MITRISEKTLEPGLRSALNQMPEMATKWGIEVVPESGSFAGTPAGLFVANMPLKWSGDIPMAKIEKGGDLVFVYLSIPKEVAENNKLGKLTSGYYVIRFKGDAKKMTAEFITKAGVVVQQFPASLELTDEKTGQPVSSIPKVGKGQVSGPFGGSAVSTDDGVQFTVSVSVTITVDGTFYGFHVHAVVTIKGSL